MASVTALQLANRVLRRVQKKTVASFDDHLGAAALDLVNAAKNEILESRIWPFDVRHDGYLRTRASYSGTSASVTEGDTAVTMAASDLGGSSGPDALGNLNGGQPGVARIAITSDSDYGDTAFRIDRTEPVVSAMDPARVTLEDAWPRSASGQSFTTFTAEYVLPDTIRSVLSVRLQEDEIHLAMIDPYLGFDQLIPHPLDEIHDEVAWVGVGGYAVPTYDESLAFLNIPEPGLRMVLHPIPASQLVLHYRYVYRHPDFASPSDTLEGVPPAIQNEIVNEAVGQYLMSPLGGEPETGRALLRERSRSTARKADAARTDPFRRRVPQPLDTVRGFRHDPFPRPFGKSEL